MSAPYWLAGDVGPQGTSLFGFIVVFTSCRSMLLTVISERADSVHWHWLLSLGRLMRMPR